MSPDPRLLQLPHDSQLNQLDRRVLRDLVRFGVLTRDQIARRLTPHDSATTSLEPSSVADRLAFLLAGRWIELWHDASDLQRVSPDIYSATPRGASVTKTGLRRILPSAHHLAHDVTLVDLADYVVAHEPLAEWRTEREASSFLRGSVRSSRELGFVIPGRGHKPDGLLLLDGKCLAVELEHSDKGDQRYASICRWFATNLRIDGVRWYVDDDRIIARLRRVSAQHGFSDDVDFTYAPFPPGVVMRRVAIEVRP